MRDHMVCYWTRIRAHMSASGEVTEVSTNPKQCPYLLGISTCKINCRELAPGVAVEQCFSSDGEASQHYAQYCAGEYYLCPVAEELNEIYRQYEDSPCPYNRNVLCFFKDTCHRCGWDPVVSLDRLKLQYPHCSERRLEKLLSKK